MELKLMLIADRKTGGSIPWRPDIMLQNRVCSVATTSIHVGVVSYSSIITLVVY